MINLNIIGITGRKRHGKDTLGDYLVSNYGYTKIGFADAHISESYIDELQTNYTIKNSRTIEELYENFNNIVSLL